MNYHARLHDGMVNDTPGFVDDPWDVDGANIDQVQGLGVYGTAGLAMLRDEMGLPMEGFVANDTAAFGGAAGVAAQNK